MTESLDAVCAQIRRALSWPEGVTQDQLVELLERYGRLVHVVNRRLDRARAWLRQGLRTEALGLVEERPDAVDAAVQLCLGYGWHQWVALCKNNDAGSVPCPDIVAAGDLSDAYDREQLLTENLAKLRMLALANGSLAKRLAVLKGLSFLDPDNPIWRQQRRDLESYRLEQVRHEVQTALSANDLTMLRHLDQELQNADWLTAPPARLRKSVAKSVKKLERAEARTRFGSLADELHEAQGMQDEHTLARLVEEWEQLLARSGVEPEASVATDVAPILSSWRHGQAVRLADREFHKDLVRMEQLLDDYAVMPELEPLFEKLCRAERALPRSIIARYESRRDEYKRQRGFRMRVIAGSAVCAILVIAGALGWWMTERSRTHEVQTWVVQLEAALRDKDLTRTKQLLDELHASRETLWASASIVAKRAEYDRLVGADAVRRTALQACLQEIESADPLDPAVDTKLKEGKELARTEEERLHVAKLRERIARARRDSQSTIDDAFRRVLVSLGNEYRATLDRDLPGERIPLLDRLAERYDSSIQGAKASEELIETAKEQLRTLRHDLDELRRKVERTRAIATALKKLSTAYHNLDSYADAAHGFVDTFPDRSEAQALQTVLNDSQGWNAVERWNALAESWQNKLAVVDAQTAQRLIEAITGDLANEGIMAGNGLQDTVSNYLARAAAALDPNDSGMARLGRLFKQPWMRRLQQIHHKDGTRYYILDGEVSEMSSSPPLYRVTGVVLSLEALMEPSLRTSKFLGKIDDPNPEPAPLSLFSEKAGLQLEKQGATQWRTLHVKLAQKVIEYPDVDPLLRLQFARIFLDWHRREGWPPTSDDGPTVEWLNKIEKAQFGRWDLGEVPWPDPKLPDVVRARKTATTLIDKVPDLGQLVSQSDVAFRELEQHARPWRPVGLVWRSDQGETAFLGTIPDGPVGMVRLDGSGEVDFFPRGRMQQGVLSFSVDATPEFGTPLFAPPPWFSDSNEDDDE